VYGHLGDTPEATMITILLGISQAFDNVSTITWFGISSSVDYASVTINDTLRTQSHIHASYEIGLQLTSF